MKLIFALTSVFTLAKCLSDSDFPQNAAVLAGQQTTMNCRSEGDIWWKYKSRAEPMKEIVLFKEGNFSADCERCTINSTEPKQFDLVINNTRLSDAGTYSCVEILENTTNHSETARHYSELIVIASVPECSTNLTEVDDPLMEGDYLQLWCVIEVRGNFEPTMEWRNDITGEIISSQATVSSNRNVKSELTVKLKCDDHRVSFSCTTYFSSTNVESNLKNVSHYLGASKIVPLYKNTWVSPVINISHQNDSKCKNIYLDNNSPGNIRVLSSKELDETSVPFDSTSSSSSSSSVTLIIIFVMVLLISAAIISCMVIRNSDQGCLHKMSVGQFPAGNRGDANIYYENPTECPDSIRVSRQEDPGSMRPNNNSENSTQSNSYMHISSREGNTLRNPGQAVIQSSSGETEDEANWPAFAATSQHNEGAVTHGNKNDRAHQYVADNRLENFHHEGRHRFPVNEITTVTPSHLVVADGTIYTDVNAARRNDVPGIMQPREPIKSLFSTSVYASIDHTVHYIPPPRQTNSSNPRNL